MKHSRLPGLAPTLLFAALTLRTPAVEDTNYFGFNGPENFPIEWGIGHLHAADVDGDGLNDLVVVNNARSKIQILYNQTGKTNTTGKLSVVARRDINELPPDARFRIDAIASEKRIAGFVANDLNADGRPDIAYFGDKELVVQYNQGTNGWSSPRRFPLEDGQLSPNALTSGDLNGDGRTDLVLLGENVIYLIPQKADHTLAEPERIPFSGAVKSLQVIDVDGDGRADLLLSNWDSPNPLRFRLQNSAGQLGPEVHFSMPPIRSYTADDLEGDRKTEVVVIAQQSGRAQVHSFQRKAAEQLVGNFRAGQFQILPLNKTGKPKRGITWGDVNGDGRADLLVAEPETGQLTIYLQQADGALGAGKPYPTFTGVSDLAVADWDGDGKPEIFLLSGDERQVGVTRYDDQGRVAFPTTLPLDGKPLAMAVGRLDPQGRPVLALIMDADGKRTLVTRTADGKTKAQRLSESFKSNPVSLTFHDANQDGLNDLIALIPYEKIKFLLQVQGKDFDEQDVAPPGGGTEQPWLSTADVDSDGKAELLLPQKSFLRAVVLQPEAGREGTNRTWNFTVKDQINGAANNSRIMAAAAVATNGRGAPVIFLLDAERKVLTATERDTNGVWQIRKNLQLPVTEFTELQPIALGSNTPNAVAFIGPAAVAWMPLSGDTWDFAELDGYETPIKDGRLNDVVTGDLNLDGRKDLVFLETAKNYLDLAIFDKNRKLVPMNRWQVFEERTFRGRRGEGLEPREAVIGDVTGDKKNDLIILVHDRVLVYPQE